MSLPRAGAATAALVAALAAALALSTPAARAQSVANPNDQPTPGTLPPGTPTTKNGAGADRSTGNVSPPSRIKPSTTVRGGGEGTRTNPLDHLPPNYRARSGTGE